MMLTPGERLKQNIAEILRRSERLAAFVSARPELDEDETQRLSYSCAELALLALCASDDTEALREVPNLLVRTELVARLREIAMACLSVQEWEQDAIIRCHIQAVEAACAYLRTNVPLPEQPTEPAVTEQTAVDASPTATKPETPEPDGSGADEPFIRFGAVTALSMPHGEREADRLARLRAELRALRELLTSLILERDRLLNVEKRDLEAAYMLALGKLETEAYLAEYDMRLRQRRLELMQAMRNRRRQIDAAEVDEQLRAAREEFQKLLEELVRKAAEAEAHRREQEKKQAEKARKKAKKQAESQRQIQKPDARDGGRGDGKTDSQDAKTASDGKGTEHTEESGNSVSEDEDEDRKLKRLYRRIVKAMHPDLHPDQDEATKELFKKAILAYKEGRLRELEEIAAILDGQTSREGEALLEALEREREHLFELILGLRAELRAIRRQFPFNKQDLLNDPARLQAAQERLRKRKEQARQRAAYYQKRIDELEAEDGRADHP